MRGSELNTPTCGANFENAVEPLALKSAKASGERAARLIYTSLDWGRQAEQSWDGHLDLFPRKRSVSRNSTVGDPASGQRSGGLTLPLANVFSCLSEIPESPTVRMVTVVWSLEESVEAGLV